jgi:hypothetical protein
LQSYLSAARGRIPDVRTGLAPKANTVNTANIGEINLILAMEGNYCASNPFSKPLDHHFESWLMYIHDQWTGKQVVEDKEVV